MIIRAMGTKTRRWTASKRGFAFAFACSSLVFSVAFFAFLFFCFFFCFSFLYSFLLSLGVFSGEMVERRAHEDVCIFQRGELGAGSGLGLGVV